MLNELELIVYVLFLLYGNFSPIENNHCFFINFVAILFSIDNSFYARLYNHLSTLVTRWSCGVEKAVGEICMLP